MEEKTKDAMNLQRLQCPKQKVLQNFRRHACKSNSLPDGHRAFATWTLFGLTDSLLQCQ